MTASEDSDHVAATGIGVITLVWQQAVPYDYLSPTAAWCGVNAIYFEP